MGEKVEVDIGLLRLRDDVGQFRVTKDDFKAEFFQFITDHYLRKFHLFLYALDTSNHLIQPTLSLRLEIKHLSWNERIKKSLLG